MQSREGLLWAFRRSWIFQRLKGSLSIEFFHIVVTYICTFLSAGKYLPRYSQIKIDIIGKRSVLQVVDIKSELFCLMPWIFSYIKNKENSLICDKYNFFLRGKVYSMRNLKILNIFSKFCSNILYVLEVFIIECCIRLSSISKCQLWESFFHNPITFKHTSVFKDDFLSGYK